MALLELRGLKKTYGNGFVAVREIELEIEEGEFVVLLGPSGCGKTTILRMIAGFEKVTEGDILLEGRSIRGLAPKDRDISMIFQSYAVWPHMTVRGNIAYPLKLRKYSRDKIDEIVSNVAKICAIDNNLDMYPNQLSGGQRQRVAVARAIAVKPKLFLMDEPLSNLDAKLRVSVRTFLKQIHMESKASTIFVTHDQSEAMALADRIIVMNKGTIEQAGSPMDIYSNCQSLFVTNFVGSPPANVIDAEIVEEGGAYYAVSRNDFKLRVPSELSGYCNKSQIVLAIRPENIFLNGQGEHFFDTKIQIIEPQGSHTILAVMVHDALWKIVNTEDASFVQGQEIRLSTDEKKVLYFEKETGQRIYTDFRKN
jgi:multiple sugar transport system ATP-binding protein